MMAQHLRVSQASMPLASSSRGMPLRMAPSRQLRTAHAMPCLALASRRSPATERVFGEQLRARLPSAAEVPAVSVPALEQPQQPLWQRLAKKTLSAMAVGVLALTLALGPIGAGPAEAGRSGGRVGGSSFSSARSSAGSYSSGRSYSGAGAGYGGGGGGGYSSSYGLGGVSTYSAPTLRFGPSFFYPSPFSGFGGYGYGQPMVAQRGGDGGFGGVLLFLLAAGALVWFLQGSRTGDGMSLGGANRVGVAKVQVGLLGSARSLQRDLERIAKRADTNSSDGLAYVLQETVLALMRNPEYSIYGAAKVDNEGGLDAGEDRFNEVSMAERRKFEEETLVNVSGRTKNRGATGRWAAQPGQNELIVVTILVAAQGGLKLPPIRSQEELTTALTKLGSLRPDQVLAVEVLWTPQDDGDYFTREDLATDYPYLNTL